MSEVMQIELGFGDGCRRCGAWVDDGLCTRSGCGEWHGEAHEDEPGADWADPDGYADELEAGRVARCLGVVREHRLFSVVAARGEASIGACELPGDSGGVPDPSRRGRVACDGGRSMTARRQLADLLRREPVLGKGEAACVRRSAKLLERGSESERAVELERLAELGLGGDARVLLFYLAVRDALRAGVVVGEAQALGLQKLAVALEFDEDVAALFVRWVQDRIEVENRGRELLTELVLG